MILKCIHMVVLDMRLIPIVMLTFYRVGMHLETKKDYIWKVNTSLFSHVKMQKYMHPAKQQCIMSELHSPKSTEVFPYHEEQGSQKRSKCMRER